MDPQITQMAQIVSDKRQPREIGQSA